MKNIILFLFLICSIHAIGTNYYVKATGNDANTGLSDAQAWQTITKVNSFTFSASDKILFNRGDTWTGTIIPKYSASDLAITYGAYGTGQKPIINGFTSITTGWTNEGGGIYSKIITAESQTNMLLIDGVQYAMGRTPNSGSWNIYDVVNSATSVTDNQLSGSPSWEGAEAAIYMNGWEIDRTLITDHTDGTIVFTNLAGSNTPWLQFSGGKYFFQNSLQTLNAYGEWYHDYSGTGKLYIYFGGVNPDTKTVKVATLNNLLYNGNHRTYLTIRDLNFVGCIKDAISLKTNNANCNILACSGSEIGLSFAYLSGNTCKVDSCIISSANRSAVALVGTDGIVTNNSFSNIGLLEAQGSIRDQVTANSAYKGAIWAYGNNATIQSNSIASVGYCGVLINNSSVTVLTKRNFITNTGVWRWDYGSIYVAGTTARVNFIIEENTIIGAGGTGIYIDELANLVTVRNNNIANCVIAGIKLSGSSSITTTGNTIYNCGECIALVNWNNLQPTTGHTITGNTLVALADTTKAFSFVSKQADYTTQLATHTINNNYYARPHLDTNSIEKNVLDGNGEVLITLAAWQSFSSQDANSKKSPKAATLYSDIMFAYNETASAKVVNIANPGMGIDGVTRYGTSFTLQPYTSVVVIKDLLNPSSSNKLTKSSTGKPLKTSSGLPIYTN